MTAAANASMEAAVKMVVGMGVSAAGKSTVGRLLTQALRATYLDGDDFHPPENVARMADEAALAFDLALVPAPAQIVDRILQPEVVPHG